MKKPQMGRTFSGIEQYKPKGDTFPQTNAKVNFESETTVFNVKSF